jgi:Xaa-Pro aminopeptidase
MPHERRIGPQGPLTGNTGGPGVAAPGNPAHEEWRAAGLDTPDMAAVRQYRLDRLRAELRRRDAAGAVLTDPLNIRYATDTSNMQVWCLHNPVRYCFVATEGPVVVFDFEPRPGATLGWGLTDGDPFTVVTEQRPATSWFYFESGSREGEHARKWAAELADLVRLHGGGNTRLCIDKVDPAGAEALTAEGMTVLASQDFTEEARKIKHPEEIKAMRRAIHTAEVGMTAMWHALEPGITENQLWALLHHANIARGGEWIETRLLSSGPRTNPWFQECADRVIEAGDMMAFDTDLIGPYGACADMSRAWVTPGRAPTNEQHDLHAIAVEHIAHNADLIGPGVGFLELTEKGHRLPSDCRPNRYGVMLHGVGLCDEYPSVRYPEDVAAVGYEGAFEPGMCVCVEAYVGRVGGREGVKLERQGLVTQTGLEWLDTFPMDLVPPV